MHPGVTAELPGWGAALGYPALALTEPTRNSVLVDVFQSDTSGLFILILAIVTPTRPPANLRALLAQAEAVIQAETRRAREAVMRHGPSEPALRALDAIHDRIESPADKLLRSTEPWSSYGVLPLFALANAGVALSLSSLGGSQSSCGCHPSL